MTTDTTPQPQTRSATPLVLAMVALAAIVVAYFAAGMRGMDHSADSPMTMNHAAHRIVGPSEFSTMLDDPTVTAIDVHQPADGQQLSGTDLVMPFDALDTAQLPADVDRTLAVYCRNGSMSAIAVEQLLELGYRNVVELDGGSQSWAETSAPRAD